MNQSRAQNWHQNGFKIGTLTTPSVQTAPGKITIGSNCKPAWWPKQIFATAHYHSKNTQRCNRAGRKPQDKVTPIPKQLPSTAQRASLLHGSTQSPSSRAAPTGANTWHCFRHLSVKATHRARSLSQAICRKLTRSVFYPLRAGQQTSCCNRLRAASLLATHL